MVVEFIGEREWRSPLVESEISGEKKNIGGRGSIFYTNRGEIGLKDDHVAED